MHVLYTFRMNPASIQYIETTGTCHSAESPASIAQGRLQTTKNKRGENVEYMCAAAG